MSTESPRVLCVGDADSRMRWTVRTALRGLKSPQLEVVVTDNVPERVVRDSVGSAPFHRTKSLDRWADSVRVADYDYLIASATGSVLNQVITHARLSEKRPFIVTGYEGLVYEKHAEGLLWRYGSDAILVNSERDMEYFRRVLSELRLPDSCLVLSGFSGFARSETYSPPDKQMLVFAPQPTVPASRSERQILLTLLSGFASNHPDCRVVVKPRNYPGEGSATPYFERHHYEVLFKEMVKGSRLPANIEIAYGALDTYLEKASVLVSVSSTALLV